MTNPKRLTIRSARERAVDTKIRELGVTIEEAQEMMRVGLMFWVVGAQAYARLWPHTAKPE